MAKDFLKVFIVALILVGLYSSAQAIPTVSLNLMDSDIYVGDSFNVQVLVDGDGIGLDLLSFGFDINTTGGVFTYDSYVIGPGFDDDSFFVPPSVAGSTFPGIADDDVLLATLSFTATSAGTGWLQAIGLTDNLFYGLAYEIDLTTTGWYDIDASQGITISPNQAAPVPEPSTCSLLCLGILSIVCAKKKYS